jgi:hypothetical protein
VERDEHRSLKTQQQTTSSSRSTLI